MDFAHAIESLGEGQAVYRPEWGEEYLELVEEEIHLFDEDDNDKGHYRPTLDDTRATDWIEC